MIISENGTIIKVASSGISKIGRATQGVKVMKTDGSKVSKLAVTPKSEEEETDEEYIGDGEDAGGDDGGEPDTAE